MTVPDVILTRTPFDRTHRPAYRQVSRVVRHTDLLFTSGHLDTDGDGRVCHPGDLHAQTRRSMSLLLDGLQRAGGDLSAIGHLQVFYRVSPTLDFVSLTRTIRESLPPGAEPVVVWHSLAAFPKGVEIEVDALAGVSGGERWSTRRCEGAEASRRGRFFVAAGECAGTGEDGVRRSLEALHEVLTGLDVSFDDVCRVRYATTRLADQPDEMERRLALRLREGAAVCTRVPMVTHSAAPAARIELMGVEGAVGRRQPPSEREPLRALGYADAVPCRPFLFVGGQLPPPGGRGSAGAQIQTVMRRLRTLLEGQGASLQDVLKVNAFHRGPNDLERWIESVQQRCDFYPDPGPASTGVELPDVGARDAALVVDCIAAAFDTSSGRG